MENRKLTVIAIIVGALGTIPKNLENRGRIEGALLLSAGILWKILECWGDVLLLGILEKNHQLLTRVKNLESVKKLNLFLTWILWMFSNVSLTFMQAYTSIKIMIELIRLFNIYFIVILLHEKALFFIYSNKQVKFPPIFSPTKQVQPKVWHDVSAVCA